MSIPPHVEREGRLLRGLQAQSRHKRTTSVEVYCRCEKSHLLLSVHPVAGSPSEVAVWVHGGAYEPVESLGEVGDPLGTMRDLLARAELTDAVAKSRAKAADQLLVRPLARLAAGETYLGSLGAACVRRAVLSPQTAGPLIAEEHEAWLAGGRGKRRRLFAN